jgi:predicted nuclease of restriction endonuclease-like (RecB) superfamily
LLDEFPGMKGFSSRNLKLMRQWVSFWTPIGKQAVSQFVQQLVAQIPWGHNQLIMNRIKNHDEALFYVRKTIENNWSRAVLTHQIESGL